MTRIDTELMKNLFGLFISIPATIGNSILLTSLLYLSIQIVRNKLNFHMIVKVIVFLTTLSSITVSIFAVLPILNVFLKEYYFSQSYPPGLSMPLLFIVFPLLFTFYLAWREEIPLFVRYAIIVGYFVFICILSALGFVVFMEQFIWNGKACLGITCEVRIGTKY